MNPFEGNYEKKEREVFALLETSLWFWVKTDSGDDEKKPNYNLSSSGVVFDTYADCPFCGDTTKSLYLYTNFEVDKIDWVCMSCGAGGTAHSGHGEADLRCSEDGNDQKIILPAYIVISPENPDEKQEWFHQRGQYGIFKR